MSSGRWVYIRSMRAIGVCLVALAAGAHAQDEIYRTTWIVGEDGELLGWPDPDGADGMEQTFKPFPVFKDFATVLRESAPWSVVFLLAAGPTDLVSLCDPERHLRKSNQCVLDVWLLCCINADWMAESAPMPERRRAFLDTLLAWRVLGSRGVKDAAEMLKALSEDDRVDAITRRAAGDIAAMLEGRILPVVELPPLTSVPAEFDVLVVVDERRIPAWKDAWRLLRTFWLREVRSLVAQLGAAVNAADLCHGQWVFDRDSEMFYELARRFGNARIDRALLALRLPPEGGEGSAGFLLQCEGIFEVKQLRAACDAAGVKIREGSFTLPEADVFATPHMLIASSDFPAGRIPIPDDLAKLGLGGDDAVWIHCRRMPFGDTLPVKGIETVTLRASFEGGVAVRCDATLKDEAAAKAAAAELERWKGLKLEPVAFREASPEAVARVNASLGSLTVSVEGAGLVAQWSLKGQTPESLLKGVIDLEALYASEAEVPEGEGGGDGR